MPIHLLNLLSICLQTPLDSFTNVPVILKRLLLSPAKTGSPKGTLLGVIFVTPKKAILSTGQRTQQESTAQCD